VKLIGFTDSYWVGSMMERKSTSGCYFNLGSGFVSWFNKKRNSEALRSTEGEYIASILESCEAIWLHNILIGLFGQDLDVTVIHCYNQTCIKLSENPVF
jgi:hypothetical protein